MICRSKGHLFRVLPGLAAILLGFLLSGCASNPGLKAREASLDLSVPYERGQQADAVRLSNPFWIDDDTFGWLEIHHYFRPENKPHGKVGATLWLMTYHVPTAEQTRELYLVTDSEYRRPLDTVRFDRDIFVRIYPRHYSDVIEKDLSYRISPGNDLHVSDQTGRHLPLDYRFGLHLSGQVLSTLFDAEDREARRIRTTGTEFRFFDVVKGEIVQRVEIHDERLIPANEIEGRLLSPTTLFLCHQIKAFGVATEDGHTHWTFRFLEYSLSTGELTSLGSFRTQANGLFGWDVSRDGRYVVFGSLQKQGEREPRSLVLRRPESIGDLEWKVHERTGDLGIFPAISPDGKKALFLRFPTQWIRPRSGTAVAAPLPYFIEPDPLKYFTIHEIFD